jgi:hypothetical protein
VTEPAARKREPLDALLLVGDQMSNLCFNLSQRNPDIDRNRQVMRELCSEWDFHRRLLRLESRQPRKPKVKP